MAEEALMEEYLSGGVYAIAGERILGMIREYENSKGRRLNQAEQIAIRDILFEFYQALRETRSEAEQNELERIMVGLVRDFFRTGVAPITRPIVPTPAPAPPEDRGIRGPTLPELGGRVETADPEAAGRVETGDPASRRGSIGNPLNPR